MSPLILKVEKFFIINRLNNELWTDTYIHDFFSENILKLLTIEKLSAFEK